MADPGMHRLSARLRRDTWIAHGAAHSSRFLDALATGLLPWEAYADLAAQHWFLYESLELAARTMIDDPVARTFVFPELDRLPALEADLRFLYGPRWSSRIAALPATTTYCTRVRYAANSHPIGFVAHHYTRYLGDLSGGRQLGRAIARAYGFAGDGLRFFVFADLDPEAFETYYRQLLDTVPWSPDEQDEFITEVLEACRLTIAMHDDLRQRWT
ncbi:biliverdin-producing heme oxygenase [Paractinoplanes ferrugineus]|uniref:Heme oxygenase n=1 Tax=Paractinoplanes ferrugineus TaxID=113564 RepID=A0A919IXN5_9ACTN|nr:biliverdin-producing heme oxygenase [Actinoplanes ferrugineus]GIE10103.1 heme oxygenase [Actinoplanes ferrugineus]